MSINLKLLLIDNTQLDDYSYWIKGISIITILEKVIEVKLTFILA